MALHRDIYWVGRQWAVTGSGVQACDQKQKSQFDIDLTRLWDDDVVDRLRTNKWLIVEDLEKALAIARQRFPEPSGKPARTESETIAAAAPVAPIQPLVKTVRQAARLEPSKPAKLNAIVRPPAAPAARQTPVETKPDHVPPTPAAPVFQLPFSAKARFLRPWRVRMKE